MSASVAKPAAGKAAGKGPAGAAAEASHIRVVLYSTDVEAIERACSEIKRRAQDNNLAVKGPVRIPTKTMRLTTRKSPCGEGTNTWDRFEMRTFKRVIDLNAPSELLKVLIVPVKGVDFDFWFTDRR
eukprot:CAMPEP_0181323438 /NCGR_PEP_ID=MMETSP1101-20121128/19786_1 /TAXON_ID=46948 /ORGANISM="Rhodomonas abbreviata, Strain Caron Lab Isolate" /LENGTH=126 /DNA_ID=CAMNT_0023431467 /DNA_START=55 /DNA_END=435 /DNA_ORIENTATION=+